MKVDSTLAHGAVPDQGGAVDTEIRSSVTELATSLAGLFASLPVPVTRAPDLVRALSIDNPLACRLLRVAHSADPAEAVEFLPTVNQIRRVVDQAGALAPDKVAHRARAAIERFGSLVDELGVDQRGFESLVSALSPKGVRRVEMQHRRAAFRANSYMWGLSTQCMVTFMILLPSETGGYLDLHAVQGFIGARITRPNAKVMFGSRMRPDAADISGVSALDEKSMPAATMLTEFSTVKTAALREVNYGTGFRGTRIDFRGVRPSDAETLFIKRHVVRFVKTNTSEYAASNSLVTWPAAMMHKDLIVPVGYTDPDTVVHEAYARREDPRCAFEIDPDDDVPLRATVKTITGVSGPPPAPEVPHLPELFASIAGKQIAAGMKFDVYRSKIPFPMMHALVCLKVRHKPVES